MKSNDFLGEWRDVDIKAECLYSLLSVMALSLKSAEEDDMEKCLFIASNIAGEISKISSEAESKICSSGSK